VTARERFLRIEPRRADDAPESESADRARIAAVIDAAPPSISTDLRRIELAPEAPAGDGTTVPSPQVGLELDAEPSEEKVDLSIDTAPVRGQPFVRCTRCGADNTIHAVTCVSCSAQLDTAEQRAFNEKVWDAQTQRNERERAALADMAQARAEAIRTSLRPLPEPGMKPPPELLDPIQESDGPLVVEAIKALRSPKGRAIASALVVGLPLFLVTLGGPIFGKIGWALAVMVVLGFIPRRAVNRLFEKWFGAPRG